MLTGRICTVFRNGHPVPRRAALSVCALRRPDLSRARGRARHHAPPRVQHPVGHANVCRQYRHVRLLTPVRGGYALTRSLFAPRKGKDAGWLEPWHHAVGGGLELPDGIQVPRIPDGAKDVLHQRTSSSLCAFSCRESCCASSSLKVEHLMEIMYKTNTSATHGLFPTKWDTHDGTPRNRKLPYVSTVKKNSYARSNRATVCGSVRRQCL